MMSCGVNLLLLAVFCFFQLSSGIEEDVQTLIKQKIDSVRETLDKLNKAKQDSIKQVSDKYQTEFDKAKQTIEYEFLKGFENLNTLSVENQCRNKVKDNLENLKLSHWANFTSCYKSEISKQAYLTGQMGEMIYWEPILSVYGAEMTYENCYDKTGNKLTCLAKATGVFIEMLALEVKYTVSFVYNAAKLIVDIGAKVVSCSMTDKLTHNVNNIVIQAKNC